MKRTVHKEMERQQDNERKQEDYDECNIYTTHQCVCHGIHNRGILVDHQISFWRIPLALFGGHKKIGRINFVFIKSCQTDSRNRVYLFNGINFIVPKHNPEEIVAICQVNVYRVTFYAEIPAIQFYVVTHIQAVHQAA